MEARPRTAHGLGTHSMRADTGGFLGHRARPIYIPYTAPRLRFPTYSTVFKTSKCGQVNRLATGSPRMVLTRRLSSTACSGDRAAPKGDQPPQKKGGGEGRRETVAKTPGAGHGSARSTMLCLSRALGRAEGQGYLMSPNEQALHSGNILRCPLGQSDTGERQAMFLFIISQHVHLRPHRKRFHAKYTNTMSKMPRRQERGKKGWFTAEKSTSEMLPGFPLGNNCCICK